MKKLYFCFLLFISLFSFGQNVGVGTTSPEFKFHVLTNTGEAGVGVQNDASTGYSILSLGYGARASGNGISLVKFGPTAAGTSFGLPRANLSIMSSDAGSTQLVVGTINNSSLHFGTNNLERMRITNTGFFGIGTTAPDYRFHIASNSGEAGLGLQNDNATGQSLLVLGNGARIDGNGLALLKFGTSAAGSVYGLPKANLSLLSSDYGSGSLLLGTANNYPVYFGTNNTVRMQIRGDGNTGIGVDANDFSRLHVRRLVDIPIGPGTILGAVYGENGSTISGSGVYGATAAPRMGAIGYAGVSGYNIGTGTEKFGVVGSSTGSSGGGGYSAGVAGYGDYGVLGWTASATGAGVIAQHDNGGIALEVNNGAIKVSGVNKPAFKHTTLTGGGGNTSGHISNLSYANASSTDLLIVTHDYGPSGPYLTKPFGVWWSGSNWTIFLEDGSPMPNNARFNVLVIKQE